MPRREISNMKYKAIIADVDGTLIAPNANPVTEASKRIAEAVRKAPEKGVIFTVATARSLDWIEGLRNSLHLSAPVILDNGARIYDCKKEKYTYEAFLKPGEVKDMKIQLNEFIGIGDSYNDAGFLSLCGLKVAVENAVPEVKAIADYIAPSYDKDGVADVIEKFILK